MFSLNLGRSRQSNPSIRTSMGIAIGAAAGIAGTMIAQRLKQRGGVNRVTDKIGKWGRKGAREARQRASYVEGQMEGVRARMERIGERNVPPNDRTLALKVESEALRGGYPTVSVNAHDSVVELRGEVDSKATADELVDRVRRVDGVREVHDLLHLPGEMPPNKEAAIRASR